tara:strand:- start:4288 stop:5262 length:975 start_codon:yes stop_codon:yes gene_type:complete
MGRGPGAKRRFSNRDFILSETFRQGALADTMTFEQRQKEAAFRAKILRDSGFNARIVNGSGWTAIYVAQPKIQMPKVSTGARGAGAGGLVPVKTFEGPPPSDGDRFPESIGINWRKELDLKTFKDREKKKKPKPSAQSDTLMKRVEATFFPIMEKAIADGNGSLMNDGMGFFEPKVTITDKSKVTNLRFVTGKEAQQLLETITVKQGKQAFSSWFKSAAQAGEVEWGKSKRDEATKYARMFGGYSAEEDIPMFVIYVDNKPAYWSPTSGKLATLWKDQIQKSKKRIEELEKEGKTYRGSKSKKKDDGTFKGWDRFSPTGTMGGM